MSFQVNVYCKKCHRESVIQLMRGITENDVNNNFMCPICETIGDLVYVSSIGKKQIKKH